MKRNLCSQHTFWSSLGVVLQASSGASQVCDTQIQGIPAFRNFIICDPPYFAIILKALDLFPFCQCFNLWAKIQCIFLGFFRCSKYDANLLKKLMFEKFWTHFEVLFHKVSLEFMNLAFNDFLMEPKITKYGDPM